jgi:ribosomal protein L5
MDFLQKLTYIVLPSQNGFAGVSSRAFDRAGNLHFRWVRVCSVLQYGKEGGGDV